MRQEMYNRIMVSMVTNVKTIHETKREKRLLYWK